jgi:Protein tyrosine and serine/threonine kinase/WD40-like Beta Propeller Repeat
MVSPEQAAGKRLDARSDIFSLGVVLYELLAGRRPFSGATDLELLQAITHRAPEAPPLHLPAGLRFVLEKALASDPAERYQSMRELVVDLRRLARQTPEGDASSAIDIPAPRRRAWPWLVALATVTAGAAALALVGRSAGWLPRRTPASLENPLANASFTRFTNFEGTERSAAISRDGKFVAFRADRAGPLDVWIGQVGTGRFINRTQGVDDELSTDSPSVGFSPDGSEIWLNGAAGRRLRLLAVMGTTPQRPFLPQGAVSVAWSPDASRVTYHLQDEGDSLFVADRTGANARLIFRQAPNQHNHYPVWSPDGRWIYFTSGIPAIKQMDLWRISPEGGPPQRLTQHNADVASPAPLDDRTVLYVARDQDGSGPWLWAVDAERQLSRRISLGVDKYMSVAASADGRRLVATVANPSAALWTIPIFPRGWRWALAIQRRRGDRNLERQ